MNDVIRRKAEEEEGEEKEEEEKAEEDKEAEEEAKEEGLGQIGGGGKHKNRSEIVIKAWEVYQNELCARWAVADLLYSIFGKTTKSIKYDENLVM